ncbi:MAG: cytochrome c [Bacteroidota bacterium]
MAKSNRIQLIISLYWIALSLAFLCLALIMHLSWQVVEEDEPRAICGVPAIPVNHAGIAGFDTLYDIGRDLFKSHCATCHNRNMVDDMTGPALRGTRDRWSAYPITDLYAWIRNSQGLAYNGHPRAVRLIEEWDKTVMNPFPNLSDEEIEALLAYIEYEH